MNKTSTQSIIGGVLTALGLILSIVGLTGYTPTEKINGDDPFFPYILWGIFALLIGLVVLITGIAFLLLGVLFWHLTKSKTESTQCNL